MVILDLYQDFSKIHVDVIKIAQQFIKTAGCFNIAISGGSTPATLFQKLEQNKDYFDFSKINFYWVDERCVGPDHEDSNYKMALYNMPSMLQGTMYRMQGEIAPDLAAKNYEVTLRANLKASENDFPKFDLVLLGLGDDGHTASIFPEGRGRLNTTDCVISEYIEKHNSTRISLTLNTIKAAKNIFMLAVNKEAAVAKLKNGESVLGAIKYNAK